MDYSLCLMETIGHRSSPRRTALLAVLAALAVGGCRFGRLEGRIEPPAVQGTTAVSREGRIAFHAQLCDDPPWTEGLFLISPDGSGRRMLAKGVAAAVAWSPDGRRIAFSGSAVEDPGLSVVDIDSGNTTRLTSVSGFDGYPAWSPDGKALAFLRSYERVIVADVAEGTWKSVGAVGGRYWGLAWTPDSQWLYFTATDESTAVRYWDVIYTKSFAWRVDIATSHVEKPWSEPAAAVVPSPDGTRLAVILNQGEGVVLLLGDSEGRGLEAIDLGGFTPGCIVWSPDGSRMVVGATAPDGSTWNDQERLLVPVEGAGFLRLTENHDPDSSVSWSPDGSRIAFERSNHVVLMDLSTRQECILTEGSDPCWSP